MNPVGQHLLIELSFCQSKDLDNVAAIESVLLQAARNSGATILSSQFHKFLPIGVSGVVLLAESHLAIHTWPELDYASVDFFCCGSSVRMDAAVETLRAHFRPQNIEVRECLRGPVLRDDVEKNFNQQLPS